MRTACKATSAGGDEKSGCYASFYDYVRPALEAQGYKRLPLERFRGNRFNILFKNAASVFYLAPHLSSFFEGNADNKLLRFVAYDLKVPEYLAGCKALGLISFLVTVPLWCSIEDSSIHLMDICVQYQELVDYLVVCSTHPEKIMTASDTLSFCSMETVRSDPSFMALVQPWKHDDKVDVILRIMPPAVARLLQCIFADHLPGGKWNNAEPDIRQKTKGLPKHNKFSESVFGHLDHIMREKPNITTIVSEAYLLFSHNATLEWLGAKKAAEKAVINSEARKSVSIVRHNFRLWQTAIQDARRAAVVEKLRKAEELQIKRLRRKEKQTSDIIYWGLWQTDAQVDSALATIPTAGEKIKSLKAQLKFRQNVLNQKPTVPEMKGVFSFAKLNAAGRRIALKYTQLAVNVKKLIQHAHSINPQPQADEDQIPLLVGKQIRQRFIAADIGEEWYHGIVISQVG